MADFRKWLYAFAVVALLAGLTVPASAQTFQTCIGGAVNPTVRAEGFTELAGDITITCSGGTVTSSGNAVPAVTISVQMNVAITSKITSTAYTPAFNEALLLIDEPGLGAAGNPLLNCGATGAPFTGTSGVGSCAIIANGAPNVYSGAAGHPNVFQGRQVSNSNNQIIQFIGVPLDGGTHTLRITNLRANVVQLTGGHLGLGGNFNTFFLDSIVTFTSPNSVNAQLIDVHNGAVRNGLDSVTVTAMGPFLQCTYITGRTERGASVTLLEGFPSSFKARNWEQINDNGTYVGTPDWAYTAGSTNFTLNNMAQNVPNGFYNTESGFMYPPTATVPSPNPPPGVSNATGTPAGNTPFSTNSIGAGSDVTGIGLAGSATNGTRFAVVFSTIPAGTTISVPATVPLINQSGGGSNQTGVLLAVGATDSDGSGSGGTVGVGGTLTSGSNFTVFYEVLFADPLAIEQAVIPVSAVVAAFDGTNPQIGVTAQAAAGFAPFYPANQSIAGCPLRGGNPLSGACVTGVGPIPRFVQGLSTPADLFKFTRCACDLLFPYVVADNNFNTSIVVANTSLDPGSSFGFTAAAQSGTVTFWFFGTSGLSFKPTSFGSATGPSTITPPQTTANSVPAGSYTAFVIAPATNASAAGTIAAMTAADANLKAIAGNFAGYVIAQSQFQYCHGVASISAPGLGPQTYLGLVLDKANRAGVGTAELLRTNQVFADQLEN